MSSKKDIIEAALKLPDAERMEVAELLYESVEEWVDPEEDEAWDREIKRRLKLVDEGKATFMSWEEARRIITGGEDGQKNP